MSNGIKTKNSFGEIEARETEERKNLTLEERINNPSYTQQYNNNSSEKLYTKEDTKWYYYLGGGFNETIQKNQGEVEENLHNSIYGRVKDDKELDNSALSSTRQERKPNWDNFVEPNFKSRGTKSHFEDMRKKNLKIQNRIYILRK